MSHLWDNPLPVPGSHAWHAEEAARERAEDRHQRRERRNPLADETSPAEQADREAWHALLCQWAIETEAREAAEKRQRESNRQAHTELARERAEHLSQPPARR